MPEVTQHRCHREAVVFMRAERAHLGDALPQMVSRDLASKMKLPASVASGMRDANNAVMGSMRSILLSIVVVFAGASCKDATGKQEPAPSTGSGSAAAKVVVTPDAPT